MIRNEIVDGFEIGVELYRATVIVGPAPSPRELRETAGAIRGRGLPGSPPRPERRIVEGAARAFLVIAAAIEDGAIEDASEGVRCRHGYACRHCLSGLGPCCAVSCY